MIISQKHQTVFIHIPKCAGTSVRNMLSDADPDANRLWGWRWMERHQRYGDSAHTPLIDLMPPHMEKVRNLSTFTLTRHPVKRFFSAVAQHLSQHPYRKPKTPSEILDELTSTNIRYDPAYIHFCPQHFFIYIGRKRHIDHIFSMEEEGWEERLMDLLRFQGFPKKKLNLPTLNESASKAELEVSDEDLRRIYQLYKRDFELLGYEPPIKETFKLDASKTADRDLPHDFSAYDEIQLMDAKFRKWP